MDDDKHPDSEMMNFVVHEVFLLSRVRDFGGKPIPSDMAMSIQGRFALSKKLAMAVPAGVQWKNENKNTTQPHRGGERSPQ